METQTCLYKDKLWIVDGIEKKSGYLILKFLGGSESTTADAADVHFVNIQLATSMLAEHVDKMLAARDIDTSNVSLKRKENAQVRFNAITKELNGEINARQAAAECKLSLARYYEIKGSYDPTIGVESLLGEARGRKVGTKKISEEVERVIAEQFTLWWKGENASRRNVWKGVQAECARLALPKPAYETVCDRVNEYKKRSLAEPQLGENYASDHFDPRFGTREILKPLEQAQMDHCVADCWLRSKKDPNMPVGRPWITLIVCSKTKVILGFYVSFRYPSLCSVALALKHAVTSKEAFMKALGLSAHAYPYRGVMKELFMDNAREFKSMNLYSACVLENIRPKYRKEKQEGGICERLFGTLNIGTIHVLPGGTGSRPRKDRDYDPAKHALLTLEEFTRELTLGICEYHDTIGGDDNKSPRQRWDEYYTDKDGKPFAPAPVHNLKKFIMEVMPEKRKKVHPYGIELNCIIYSNSLLDDYIGKSLRVKYDTSNLARIAVLIKDEWVEAVSRGDHCETLTEQHIDFKIREKQGQLGDRGLAARSARIESRRDMAIRVAAQQKAREHVLHEQETGESLLSRRPAAKASRVVIADRRDFSVVVGYYPGEDDL